MSRWYRKDIEPGPFFLSLFPQEKIARSRDLGRPTPFTLNAVARYKADRNKLRTTVFVRPIQAGYLHTMIKGGTLPTVLTPINIKPDRHGSTVGKRRGLEGIKGRARSKFIATVNGTTGVWQRYGRKARKLELLVKVDRNERREPQWDFYGIAERTAQAQLRDNIRDALADALAKTADHARWR